MKTVFHHVSSGTRVYPQTHTNPEMIVRIPDKLILVQILKSSVDAIIDEAVFRITVHPQTQIFEYLKYIFGGESTFWCFEQIDQENLGHAFYHSNPIVNGEERNLHVDNNTN